MVVDCPLGPSAPVPGWCPSPAQTSAGQSWQPWRSRAYSQVSDCLSSLANRSMEVSMMRAVRAVASLWQVITPCVHGCQSSRQLDPKAEDGREHDDGGVSMAMKTCWRIAVSPSLTDALMTPGVLVCLLYACHPRRHLIWASS